MRAADTSEQHEGPQSEADLRARAGEYGLQHLETLPDSMLDSELVSELPVEWARSHAVLPVRYQGEIRLAIADPTQLDTQQYIALLLGEEPRPLLVPRDALADAIERCYYSRQDSPQAFLRDLHPEPDRARPAQPDGPDDLLRVAEQAPVTQLVNLILLEAVKAGASDIHFEPFESRLRVRYRIDGMLYDQTGPPKHMEQALISRLKVMARMDIAERRLPQDGMARVRVGDREIDIRAATLPVAEGERMVLRLLDQEAALLPLCELGMPQAIRSQVQNLVRLTNGIVIVAGPTGSGKTTTLYAALREIDTTSNNVLTIEEPIEYQLPDISQMQVRPKIGLTFANGLRHILRQDPDVILVGETRDVETAQIAVRAAMTGHLVFTTLHTNDAPSAVGRLIDMGIEPFLLAASLRAVLAQRLVRRLCPACSRQAPAGPAQTALPAGWARDLDGAVLREPAGCQACMNGFKGRTGVFELMTLDDPLRERIRVRALASNELRAAAAKAGMTSLAQNGLRLVREGITGVQELLRCLGEALAPETAGTDETEG